jgi:hypothetical protein
MNYRTQQIGARTFVMRDTGGKPDAKHIVGWLDRDIPHKRVRGGFLSRPQDWNGEWLATFDGETVGSVGSISAGLLLISRLNDMEKT